MFKSSDKTVIKLNSEHAANLGLKIGVNLGSILEPFWVHVGAILEAPRDAHPRLWTDMVAQN